MKLINHLSTSILTALAVAVPAVAGNPATQTLPSDEAELTETIDNPTTSFITLDEEALEELADLGIADNNDELANQIIDYATTHLGRPYRSGAKGPTAFDCSGFTSYVFKNYGIQLSASSRDQYNQGEKIANDEIRPGDLLFFSGRRNGKTVGHVALAVDVDDNGNVKFIHAASSKGIRYDSYPDGGYYSQRYMGARRVLN